jgi:hypothetical protein
MGDTNIPLGTDTYQRRNADEPDVRYINRFYESDPTDQADGVASIRRPGLKNRIQVGDGPIRRIFWQSGFANDDAFVFSKNGLYRLSYTPTEGDKLVQISGTFVYGHGNPSVCARSDYLFWADGVLLQYTDGVNPAVQITTPDDVLISSICVVNEFIICAVQNSDRFYWILPGATTIDPLNFATAESQPDIIVDVKAFGDQFWLFGQSTTEPWYFTGDDTAPVAPVTGRPYDRGSWGGTAVKINDEIILVGWDGVVYSVTADAVPISSPGISERVQVAQKIQLLDI